MKPCLRQLHHVAAKTREFEPGSIVAKLYVAPCRLLLSDLIFSGRLRLEIK